MHGEGIHTHVHTYTVMLMCTSMQAPRLAAQSAFVSALGRISKRLLKYRARDLRSEWGCSVREERQREAVN